MLGLGIVGIAVLALLLLTASGSRSSPGTTRSLALSWTIDVVEVIQVGVGILIIGALLWSLLRRRPRQEERSRRRSSTQERPAWAVLRRSRP